MIWLYVLTAVLFVLASVLTWATFCFGFATGWELLLMIASCVCAIAFIVALLAIPIQTIERRNCHYASSQYNRATHWDFFAGCFIRFNGRYVSLDKYQAFIEK